MSDIENFRIAAPQGVSILHDTVGGNDTWLDAALGNGALCGLTLVHPHLSRPAAIGVLFTLVKQPLQY